MQLAHMYSGGCGPLTVVSVVYLNLVQDGSGQISHRRVFTVQHMSSSAPRFCVDQGAWKTQTPSVCIR